MGVIKGELLQTRNRLMSMDFNGGEEMKSLSRFALIVAAGCLFLAACTAQVPTNADQPDKNPASPIKPDQQPSLVITPAIKETIARLKVGEIFELQIPTIPVAGFEWMIEKMDKAILSQVGESLYAAEIGPNSAGGKVIFRFKALAPGNTVITFQYAKSASDGTPGLSSKSLSVSVEVS
jgi:predicted secreted protein